MDSKLHAGPTEHVDIRHLSESEFSQLGLAHVAFIKAVSFNGCRVFVIHAADGTPFALAESRDVAMAAVSDHEMLLASVH